MCDQRFGFLQDDDDKEVKALMIVGICVAILLIILIIVAIMVWRLKVYPKTKTHRKLSSLLSQWINVIHVLSLSLFISWSHYYWHDSMISLEAVGQCDSVTVYIIGSFLLSPWQCQYDSIAANMMCHCQWDGIIICKCHHYTVTVNGIPSVTVYVYYGVMVTAMTIYCPCHSVTVFAYDWVVVSVIMAMSFSLSIL